MAKRQRGRTANHYVPITRDLFDKRVLRFNFTGTPLVYWWCPDCGAMVKPLDRDEFAKDVEPPEWHERLEIASIFHTSAHIEEERYQAELEMEGIEG